MTTATKTVLVNPAWHCLQNQDTRFIPLGLAYIAGALAGAGHEVSILNGERVLSPVTLDRSLPSPGIVVPTIDRYLEFHDPAAPIWEVLAREILESGPAIVGFSMWTASFQSVVNTAAAVKRLDPGVTTVVGGIHATIDPGSVMAQPEIDFVVSGEGEHAAVRLWETLAQRMRCRTECLQIPGVWMRVDGRVQGGGKAPLLADIDALPLPNYEAVKDFSIHNIAGIITSRGCPFGCSFCASETIWGRKVRYRSVDSCIRELEHYRDRFGLRMFRINDDTFCLNKARLKEFCGRLREDFAEKWEFTVDANVNSLDRERIELLKGAGCIQINFGIESTAPRIRESFIDKPVDLKHAAGMVDEMYAAGIASSAYFMTGFPDESEEELRTSIDFMEELRATNNIWSIVSPYPGTALYDYCLANGYLPSVSRLHLMHHSMSSNMSSIDGPRYRALLNEVAARVRVLSNQGRLRLNAVDVMNTEEGEIARWKGFDGAALAGRKHCGYCDQAGGDASAGWVVSGWAYDPGRMRPAEQVMVLNRGAVLGLIKVRLERPDVAAALKEPELLRTGWAALIPDEEGVIEPSRLEFVALAAGDPIGPMQNIVKPVEPARRLAAQREPDRNPALKIIRSHTLPSSGTAAAGPLHSIATDAAGNVYYSDELGHEVVSLDAEGGIRWRVSAGGKSGNFRYPRGLAIGRIIHEGKAVDSLAVCDAWNRRVRMMALDGSPICMWTGAGDDPFIEVVDVRYVADGGTWLVLDRGRHCLYAMTEDGRVSGRTGRCFPREAPDSLFYPDRLIGQSESIYVREPRSGRLKLVAWPHLLPVPIRFGEVLEWIAADSSTLLGWQRDTGELCRFDRAGVIREKVNIEGTPIPSDSPAPHFWIQGTDLEKPFPPNGIARFCALE